MMMMYNHKFTFLSENCTAESLEDDPIGSIYYTCLTIYIFYFIHLFFNSLYD